jgi:hypothetical protein
MPYLVPSESITSCGRFPDRLSSGDETLPILYFRQAIFIPLNNTSGSLHPLDVGKALPHSAFALTTILLIRSPDAYLLLDIWS